MYPLITAVNIGNKATPIPKIIAIKLALILLKKINEMSSIIFFPSKSPVISNIILKISSLKKIGNINPIIAVIKKSIAANKIYGLHVRKNLKHLE
jgi:hypothetical protein